MKKTSSILSLAILAFCTSAMAVNKVNYISNGSDTFHYAKYYATPLCIAISKGEVEVVKKMIAYGADINEKTNGMTPLMYAARYNQTEIISLLLEKGAYPKAKCKNGLTALKHAEISKATAAVALLKNN